MVIVAFSGARDPLPRAQLAARQIARSLNNSAAVADMVVGDASGIDTIVFYASRCYQIKAVSSQPRHLVARSAAVVNYLRSSTNQPLLVAFPRDPAPPSLQPSPAPSACFAGFGQGTWSTAALALGRLISVVVVGPQPPASFRPRAIRFFGFDAWLCSWRAQPGAQPKSVQIAF